MNFTQFCEDKIVLLDGAMGTYFHLRHPDADEAELNVIEHPEWIKDIHKEYINAGADVIRTATFAMNSTLVEQEAVSKYIESAIRCVKEAVDESGKDIFVAASIGPINHEVDLEYGADEENYQEYFDLVDLYVAHGFQIFVLETFAKTEELIAIANYIKEKVGNAFVIAQCSVNRFGFTKSGYSSKRIVGHLLECDHIDVIGFNCGISATHLAALLRKIKYPRNCKVSALPNAGYQQELRGQVRFLDQPEYYTKQMEEVIEQGVDFIGGCCGTTPKHIENLRNMLELREKKGLSLHFPKKISEVKLVKTYEYEPNFFIEKMENQEKVFVVELDAPFKNDATKFVEGGFHLKEEQVDLVTVSDSPMARARADAFGLASYLKQKADVETMPHLACRDRNVIGVRSALLGAHIQDIRNILVITGDPVEADARHAVTSVFDFNSITLMEYIKRMNEEVFKEQPLIYGGALNYSGQNIDAIIRKMKRKHDAGCSYFLTQPIYSDEDIKRVKELKERTNYKIIGGIMPLVSYKNALFMQNEMPGIHVPKEIVNRYEPEMTRTDAEKIAVETSIEIGEKLADFIDGYYIMTPFGRVGLVNRVIRGLKEIG